MYGGRPYYLHYDTEGRRIKKLNYQNVGSEYFYDGDLLIRETNPDYTLDFLYDEFNDLYGFVKDNTEEYFYIRDYFKNIVAITNKYGVIVVKYKYDAFGNFTILGDLANTIGKINPFKYKGYYYDNETSLFWLSSRYYSPELCRFISPDDVGYLDPSSINGLNLYVYCANDPINKYDPTGHFPWLIFAVTMLFTPVGGTITQAAVSTLGHVAAAGWALEDLVFNGGKGAWADMCSINWNPFNADEDKVMNSNYLSFYKGVPVLQISGMGGSMSLGLIFFDKNQGVEVLKHERGHNTQLMSMGLGNFLIQIGIPSVWKNGDETPWELSASMLGGSALANGYSEEQKREAYNYYIRACFPIINIYNIFKYIFY